MLALKVRQCIPKCKLQQTKMLNLLVIRSVITARQKFGENRSQDYLLNEKSEKIVVKKSMKEGIFHYIDDTVAHFMPKGYPYTVADGYSRFARGQMIASILGSAGGILATQSMLIAIGLNSGAIPLAATLNWVIKDGLGQLGGVIFASLVSNRFDSDPKRWRMLAAVWLEFSAFMELLTPLAPAYFIGIASLANIGKNISFLAASASRAAIHKSFATHENLADVTAKTGSQSVLSSMLGTGLGIGIAACIGDQYHLTVASFLTCSCIGTLSTYYSLSNVTINSLSPHRLEYLLAAYLGTSTQELSSYKHKHYAHNVLTDLQINTPLLQLHKKSLLSPQELRVTERFLMTPVSKLSVQYVGSDFDEAIRGEEELKDILSLFPNERFLINILTTEPSEQDVINYNAYHTTRAVLSNGGDFIDSSGNTSDASSSSTPFIPLKKTPTMYAETHVLIREGAKLHDIVKGLTTAYIARLILMEAGYEDKTRAHKSSHGLLYNIEHIYATMFGKKVITTEEKKYKQAYSRFASEYSQQVAEHEIMLQQQSKNKSKVKQKLYPRMDILRQARKIAAIEPFPGVSIASDFADKIVLGDQWLVAVGMLETKFARIAVK